MDYKEKYEMALETIQEILDSGSDSIKMSRLRLRLQSVFPELCEPEDERIRKELLEHCKSQAEPYILTGNKCPQIQSWISWLEKQGEVESDNDDIEAEEKGIREAFNKIEDEKQCKQKPQRMISAEAKEAMYNKPANTVEQKCEESKTKIFDAPTPFEDRLFAFVACCELLTLPSKIEFIKEHSQELLDTAKEQIEKEETEWTKEDEHTLQGVIDEIQANKNQAPDYDLATYDRFLSWLKSLKTRYTWKPSDEQMDALENAIRYGEEESIGILSLLYNDLKKLREDKL